MDIEKLAGPLAACKYLQKKYPFKYRLVEVIQDNAEHQCRYLFIEETDLSAREVITQRIVYDSGGIK